jgi:copper chaperone
MEKNVILIENYEAILKNVPKQEYMMQKVLKVEGMTCQHCAQTVTETVGKMTGVEKVDVSLEQKEVTIDFDELQTQTEAISVQIVEAGFEVIEN